MTNKLPTVTVSKENTGIVITQDTVSVEVTHNLTINKPNVFTTARNLTRQDLLTLGNAIEAYLLITK